MATFDILPMFLDYPVKRFRSGLIYREDSNTFLRRSRPRKSSWRKRSCLTKFEKRTQEWLLLILRTTIETIYPKNRRNHLKKSYPRKRRQNKSAPMTLSSHSLRKTPRE